MSKFESTPKHGETRNHRTDRWKSEPVALSTTDGKPLGEVSMHGGSTSVFEKYCAECKKWHKVEGVLGDFECPECKTDWFYA